MKHDSQILTYYDHVQPCITGKGPQVEQMCEPMFIFLDVQPSKCTAQNYVSKMHPTLEMPKKTVET